MLLDLMPEELMEMFHDVGISSWGHQIIRALESSKRDKEDEERLMIIDDTDKKYFTDAAYIKNSFLLLFLPKTLKIDP